MGDEYRVIREESGNLILQKKYSMEWPYAYITWKNVPGSNVNIVERSDVVEGDINV